MKTEHEPGLQALAARGCAGLRRAAARFFREAIPMPRLLGRASQNCKLHFSNPKVKRLRVNFSLHIA
ncbi:hypothetical protein [Paraburkholderia silvatlantica]|uniref:Uncharacterized protein n=1 Tax=Paraburkholderia silvatlantica TaxID=321895 RepID=A0ABR6FND9_9BURK|nr:hypothetical protein [Paraburkholderia silvatlantica]MBB2928942.1 hypothetical protein [Paraburkholderia silvatlantica]